MACGSSRNKLAIALLVSAVALQAQFWDALRSLAPGDNIRIVDSSGQQHAGTFTAVSERSLSLETVNGLVEVERSRVRRVEVRASSRRTRNILIGAAIGVGVSIAADQSAGRYLRNETGEGGGVRALTYIGPIALFSGIGALLSPYRAIYRAR